MDDFDNLPFATPRFDGYMAGVTPDDDPHIASAKVMSYELDKHNARMQELDEAARTTRHAYEPGAQYVPVSSTPVPRNVPFVDEPVLIKSSNTGKVDHYARMIEGRPYRLVRERNRNTALAIRLRQAGWIVLAVTAVLVITGMKLPFIPYKYETIEYLTSRILFVASILLIVKATSVINKAGSGEK